MKNHENDKEVIDNLLIKRRNNVKREVQGRIFTSTLSNILLRMNSGEVFKGFST